MKNNLSEFRKAVYQSLRRRADVLLDLIDALTVAGQVSSPVALSEQKPFRRKFGSVYDGLENGEMDIGEILSLLPACVPEDSERIAGYKVYAVDATANEHEAAETMPDRSVRKSSKAEPLRYGHKYSWLVRLINFGSSWVAPIDIERISSEATDTKVAAVQVQALDLRDREPKVMVADSRYENHQFLGIFERLRHTFGLIRISSNRVLYETPLPKPKGSRGAPRKHGSPFQLSEPARCEDRSETFQLGKQTVQVKAWDTLHFKKLAILVGSLLRVEFLKEDGSPRYQRPIWLFWTGSQSVALSDLCRMYLWRFAIEHLFRFLKQHMGLNSNRSPSLVSAQQWMWLCALAYWQLLLMRDLVHEDRPAWYPHKKEKLIQLTPYLVQRSALLFLLVLGTPALQPRPAGKGTGRPMNYRPMPRLRYPVLFKTKKTPQSLSASP